MALDTSTRARFPPGYPLDWFADGQWKGALNLTYPMDCSLTKALSMSSNNVSTANQL